MNVYTLSGSQYVKMFSFYRHKLFPLHQNCRTAESIRVCNKEYLWWLLIKEDEGLYQYGLKKLFFNDLKAKMLHCMAANCGRPHVLVIISDALDE